MRQLQTNGPCMLNSDNSIHGQGYQNYDGWIL